MQQRGQIVQLKSRAPDGSPLWSYRFRDGGRDAKRIQRGAFTSEVDARDALDRELTGLRRRHALASVTLRELADEYLAQHDTTPETTLKLRWLLGKSVAAFGDRRLADLDSREIAAWRMTLPPGHRFEATQALRQTLTRAIEWGLLDVNPARTGVDNPLPVAPEMRPFESQQQLDELAAALDARFGPAVLFAAATGMRPGEWIALERRDLDLESRLVHVRRSYSRLRLRPTKTKTARAVPLQRTALDALDQLPRPRGRDRGKTLLFPAAKGGHIDLHNWRPRHWRPGQQQVGIDPPHRVYDLRHTFATFSLRAGLGTFELSRYMGTSLMNIDRTYGHLARDSHQHAVEVLDAYSGTVDIGGRFVDTETA